MQISIAFKKIKIVQFEKKHISNLLPFLDENDIEHSVHDLISVKNIRAYCEFLKWCAFSTVSQVAFRKIEQEGVDSCLSVYDEALALFIFRDKYKFWRADYVETSKQPSSTGDTGAEGSGEEEDSDTSRETEVQDITPRYTAGTSKAWGNNAIEAFNELCASVSSQRSSLEEYKKVLRMVKKRWFEIDDGGNRRKRKALELMRLQLENRSANNDQITSDRVFSINEIKRRKMMNIGSVVTKYNINFTDQTRFRQEKEARRLKILELQASKAELAEKRIALDRETEELRQKEAGLEKDSEELSGSGERLDEQMPALGGGQAVQL